jgi:uncharacterized membrane protein
MSEGDRVSWLQPARAFLVLAPAFGLAFALVTPPLQAPDEDHHLYRAYAISTGQWLSEPRDGDAVVRLPTSFREIGSRLGYDIRFFPDRKQEVWRLRREFSIRLEPEQTGQTLLTSLYSPLTYAPSAAAMALARPWSPAPIVHVYLGRAASLLCWLLLVYAALRVAPAHGWTLFALALLPMSLFQAAALSADGITNGLAFLFIAVVLRASRADAGRFRWHEGILLVALSAGVGLAKLTYWPLAGLVLLIPRHRFGGRAERAAVAAAVVAGSLLPAALWVRVLRGVGAHVTTPISNPEAQLQALVAEPLRYGEVLLATLAERFGLYVETFVGILGHLDTQLPSCVYWLAPLALVALALLDGGPESPVRGWGRTWLLLIAAVAWTVAMTAAYLGWTPPGADLVDGVQGRYFIPFAPLPLLAIHLARSGRWISWLGPLTSIASSSLLAVAIWSLLERYYDWPG